MEALLRKRISISAAMSAFLLLLCSSTATANIVVSFNDDATVPHDLTYQGLTVSSGSAARLQPAEIILEEDDLYGPVAIEDIDALHILVSGQIVLSTSTAGIIDGTSYHQGDLVLWNPGDGTASLFMDHSLFTAAENIDAVFVFEKGPNAGKIALSTQLAAELGGLSFQGGDLVLYDPIADTATLLFDDADMTGTAGQKELDAIHILQSGVLVMSFALTGGKIGGVTIEQEDLIRHLPGSGTFEVFKDGALLFDGETADINAVSAIPAALPVLDPTGTTLLLSVMAAAGFWLLRRGGLLRGERAAS